VTIPADEQDPELGERLELDADAILSWAIDGWREYQERGLDEPAVVIAATDNYQRDSDAISRFLDECCVFSPVVKATTTQLFDAWEKWRAIEGAEQMSLKAFGQAITDKGYPAPKKTVNGKKFRQGIAVCTVTDSGDDDE
jgi:putative DNA primase/helicase